MKPVRMHKLDGTYQASRHKDRLDVPVIAKLPDIPDGMSIAAAAHWNERCLQLEGRRVLSDWDLKTLARLCELYVIYEKIMRDFDHGAANSGAQLGKIDRVCKLLLSLEKEFGFTPLSRNKIKTQEGSEQEEDPFDSV